MNICRKLLLHCKFYIEENVIEVVNGADKKIEEDVIKHLFYSHNGCLKGRGCVLEHIHGLITWLFRDQSCIISSFCFRNQLYQGMNVFILYKTTPGVNSAPDPLPTDEGLARTTHMCFPLEHSSCLPCVVGRRYRSAP